MDELRNLHLPSRNVAARRSVRAAEHPNRLGRTLREARLDKGLELRDLAEITHVRLTHLEALEAGDYGRLPEEVYSKNFVRLYAQAVGLDPARALLLYAQERRRAAAPPARETGLEGSLESAATPFANPLANPRLGRFLRPLLLPLVVLSVVLLALWAFNGLLATTAPLPLTEPLPVSLTPSSTAPVPAAAAPSGTAATAETPPQAPATGPEATTAATTEVTTAVTTAVTTGVTTAAAAVTEAPAAAMILFSLRTTPPGAEVSIDGYRFGQSPIVDAPVRAGARTVRVERGGYRTFERTLDLSVSRRLNVELVPTGTRGAATVTGARVQTPPRAVGRAAAPASRVTLTVTAEAWLEVYSGAARGDGERLVYATAQPGETFSFSAPVYVFSGNAGGVTVARGDAAAEPLGASGAVMGAAY